MISTTIGLIIPNVLMYRDICKVTGVKSQGDFEANHFNQFVNSFHVSSSWDIAVDLGFVFQPSGRLWSFLYVALVGAMGGGSLWNHESPYPFVG